MKEHVEVLDDREVLERLQGLGLVQSIVANFDVGALCLLQDNLVSCRLLGRSKRDSLSTLGDLPCNLIILHGTRL